MTVVFFIQHNVGSGVTYLYPEVENDGIVEDVGILKASINFASFETAPSGVKENIPNLEEVLFYTVAVRENGKGTVQNATVKSIDLKVAAISVDADENLREGTDAIVKEI